MVNQSVCTQCWRPNLESINSFSYCPGCGSQFDGNLNLVLAPNPELFNKYSLSIIEKLLKDHNGYRRDSTRLLLADLGLSSSASSRSWFYAYHHLDNLYLNYQILHESYNNSYTYPITFPRPSPSSKKSYVGDFNDYPFTYFRQDSSMFANLSNNAFKIINSPIVFYALPFPLCYLKTRMEKVKYISFLDFYSSKFSFEHWMIGINELMDFGLVDYAPTKDNLELVSIEKIRNELKDRGIKVSSRTKVEAIQNAIKYLPESSLITLVNERRAYIPTRKVITEFRLITYGLRNLMDDTRQNNLYSSGDNILSETYQKLFSNKLKPSPYLEVLLSFLEYGIKSHDYEEFLVSGERPLEATVALILMELGRYDEALKKLHEAYERDIKYNDVYSTININHFGALKRFQLQIELIKSLTNPRYELDAQVTENVLTMWVSLYKRITNEGSTSFLFDYYQEIFKLYGSLSKENENKYRDQLGIPRIGEGWVSEMELLNIVKEIFGGENVIHQASPKWLGLQHIDIFVPRKKLAIEFQGLQHYKAVEYFGGIEGLEKTQLRDQKKAELCKMNNIKLLYFDHDEPLTKQYVINKLRSHGIL